MPLYRLSSSKVNEKKPMKAEGYPHTIRLMGPWNLLLAGESPRLFHLGKEELKTACNTLQLTRRFGMPRTLAESERVFLHLQRCVGCHQLQINQVEMAFQERLDITTLLRPRNEIVLHFSAQYQLPELVQLSIELSTIATINQSETVDHPRQ